MDSDDYACAGAHGTIAPQLDEAYYDDRSDASDDETKGRIKFPRSLYGREGELSILNGLYDELTAANRVDSADLVSADSAEEVRREPSTTQLEQLDGSADSISSSAYGGSRVVFLGGYSGVGKSSVVEEFVSGCSAISARGKYTVQSEEPFSAISQVLRSLAADISSGSDLALKDQVLGKIGSSDLIAPSTDGDRVLTGTFPSLTPLLGSQQRDSSRSSSSANMHEIKSCLRELISIVCGCLSKPLVIFLDDLQWADGASIDLLTALLTDPMLRNILFVCAYRSNEIDEHHSFFSLMEKVKGKREGSESVEQMELFSLSSAAIEHFIADSVKYEDIHQVAELAEVVYQKTMGNIFFVKQALDELVRNNILFYDVMCFEWRWVVSKIELRDSMSDDVVSTVKGKIKSLSEDIQSMLIVMSNIPNALDVSTLRDLMCEGNSRTFTDGQVRAMQHEASEEGMLLHSKREKLYVFGHDRIRQASYECLPSEQRNDLRQKLARVLLRNTHQDKEWCLFVAADLLNGIPDEMKNVDEVVRLNIRVATRAKRKGSAEKEHEILREALRCLVLSGQAWKDYHLTLELYNNVIISEHSRGCYDHEEDAIDEVIINGKSLDDKAVAYLHQLLAFDASSDYSKGLRDGVEILNLYGFELPENVKPSKTYFLKEEAQFKLATRRGLYNTLNDLPSTPVPVIPIFDCVMKQAAFLSSDSATKMARILAWKAIRYTAKHGVDSDFTAILSIYCCILAKEGNVKDANEIGNVALALADRIKDHRKEQYAMTKFRIVATVTCKLQSFRGAAETLLECHKVLKFCGKTQPSLGAALNYMFAIFAAGCELGPLIESKLVLIEQFCRTVERTSFLSVFELLHQFAVNIRTTSSCELAGDIFDEGDALAKVEGNGRDMLLRDISSCRLQLAFVFGNEECMKLMLNRLKEYSFNDNSNPRLHSRLCFMGLSAFALGSKEFKSIGEKCLQYFSNLSKLGSVNARPVHLFLLALKSPSQQAYEVAIDACVDEKCVHLEAMARERFAIYLEGRDPALSKTHLEYSYWLYQDWSAHAKAAEMSRQYSWLKNTTRDKARSSTTSRTQSTMSKDSITETRKMSVVYVANTTLGIRRAVSVKNRRKTVSN